MSSLEKDLAHIMRLDSFLGGTAFVEAKALWFIRTHHAEISKLANAARRLRALEMAIAEQCNDCASVLQERADEILRAALGESP